MEDVVRASGGATKRGRPTLAEAEARDAADPAGAAARRAAADERAADLAARGADRSLRRRTDDGEGAVGGRAAGKGGLLASPRRSNTVVRGAAAARALAAAAPAPVVVPPTLREVRALEALANADSVPVRVGGVITLGVSPEAMLEAWKTVLTAQLSPSSASRNVWTLFAKSTKPSGFAANATTTIGGQQTLYLTHDWVRSRVRATARARTPTTGSSGASPSRSQ